MDLDNGLYGMSGTEYVLRTEYTVYLRLLVGNVCYRCIVSGVSVIHVQTEKRGKREDILGETYAKWRENDYHTEEKENNDE